MTTSTSLHGSLGVHQSQGLPPDQGSGGSLQRASEGSGLSGFATGLYHLAGSMLGGGYQMLSDGVAYGRQKVSDGVEYGSQKLSDGVEYGVEKLVDGVLYGAEKLEEGAQLVSDGVAYGQQKVSDGIAYGKQKVSDGVEYGSQKLSDGVEYGVEKLVDGVLYGAEKLDEGAQMVSDGVEYGKGVVSSGVESLKHGAKATGQLAVGVGTVTFEKGVGTGTALASIALRKLPYVADGQSSVFGRLPNAPGFQDAISSPESLSGELTQVRDQGGPSGQALTRLQDALQDKALSRNGKPIGLSEQQFHAALLRGAHFVVEDGGALTDSLKDIEGFHARGSSHYKSSGQTQYGLDLDGHLGHLLIGKDNHGNSFFQLESHGTGHGHQSMSEWAGNVYGHGKAYLQHVGSSMSYVQIGPKGCIEGSEKDNNHVVIR